MAKLFLQILGNSDVSVDSDEGKQLLQGYTLDEVRELAEINDEELTSEIGRVDFPLIREVKAKKQQEEPLYFGIILTNQVAWLEQQNMSPDAWNDIIASDGFWWENILKVWCEQQEIQLFPIPLEIDPSIDNGVADWEGMAILLKERLAQLVHFEENHTLQFHPPSGETKPIDEIIIQHSSGTPATSSALYLWGIEQKLAGKPIKFVYISRDDSAYIPHAGQQWQWRFKAPQIQELLKIQDFNGALNLLANCPNKDLETEVKSLDRAVSFNLANLKGVDSTAKGKVIERIAIALWSEKAFRDRGQWMHWYLRVAGAFELAILCLVEKQAPETYSWQKIDPEELKDQENNSSKDNPPSLLIYQDRQNRQQQFLLPIMATVSKLLDKGSAEESQTNTQHNIPPIQDQNWTNFKKFYCYEKWELDEKFKTGFTKVRNQLYHSLQGDKIDQYLDQKTQNLLSVAHPKHPAEIAVQYLHYVIKLAGISDPVQNRIKDYQTRVENVKEQLEWIYTSY